MDGKNGMRTSFCERKDNDWIVPYATKTNTTHRKHKTVPFDQCLAKNTWKSFNSALKRRKCEEGSS